VIAPAATKALRKLSRNEQERILAAIRGLPAETCDASKADEASGAYASETGERSSVSTRTPA
jgi:mRNA-degrading endonuclease RelE of RelBE toxin-antitoxin system